MIKKTLLAIGIIILIAITIYVNITILTAVNYPPTPEAMGWASGVSTLTNVNSSS